MFITDERDDDGESLLRQRHLQTSLQMRDNSFDFLSVIFIYSIYSCLALYVSKQQFILAIYLNALDWTIFFMSAYLFPGDFNEMKRNYIHLSMHIS